MHYLYRITNKINGKVYIGQTNNPEYRWYQHCSYAKKDNKHKQYIHHAMAKYGTENFEFEIIATCRIQEDIDITEVLLIQQYDSRNSSYGYNLKSGGSHGLQSEETKEKIRQATIKQIAEKGHPAQGHKWTEEQKANLSATLKALDKEAIYTDKVRQKMSEAHIGYTDSEETKQKKSKRATEAWSKRVNYDGIKCQAHGCMIEGKAKYKIINGARYCNKHGLRMLRYGRLNTIKF